jgi:hypothetical protein
MNDGAEVSLTGDPLDGGLGGQIRKIDKGHVKQKDADGQWHEFSSNFAISPTDAESHEYLAVVLTGQKSQAGETVGFDSVSITAAGGTDGAATTPQPSTIILFALGGTVALRRWATCRAAGSS